MITDVRLKNNIRIFLWAGFLLCIILAIFTFIWEITTSRFFYLKDGTIITTYTFDQHVLFSKTEDTKMSYWISTFSSKMPNKYILIGMQKNFTRYYVKTSRCYHKFYDLYLQQTIERTNLSTQKITEILMQYENDLLSRPQIIGQKSNFFVYLKIGGLILGSIVFLLLTIKFTGRNKTAYINEPYVTGGNPVLADNKILFNDILGTTLGVKSDKYEAISRDAFGMAEQNGAENFFTGKPYIGELGYAFLFRNYRADQGKWQTQDPLGYPDGWNNFAYGNNTVINGVDYQGTEWIVTGSLPKTGEPVRGASCSAIFCNVSSIPGLPIPVDKGDGGSYTTTHYTQTIYTVKPGSGKNTYSYDPSVGPTKAGDTWTVTYTVTIEVREWSVCEITYDAGSFSHPNEHESRTASPTEVSTTSKEYSITHTWKE